MTVWTFVIAIALAVLGQIIVSAWRSAFGMRPSGDGGKAFLWAFFVGLAVVLAVGSVVGAF